MQSLIIICLTVQFSRSSPIFLEVVNWICNWKMRYKRRWRNWTRWRRPPATTKTWKSRPKWHHCRQPVQRVSMALADRRPRDHRKGQSRTMPKPNRNNAGDPCWSWLFNHGCQCKHPRDRHTFVANRKVSKIFVRKCNFQSAFHLINY